MINAYRESVMRNIYRRFMLRLGRYFYVLKFRSSFYPLFSAATVALQSLKTQRFRIKLKDLHKQALDVCVNCLQYDFSHITQYRFQFIQGAANDSPEHLP